jgi:hypothetical protein
MIMGMARALSRDAFAISDPVARPERRAAENSNASGSAEASISRFFSPHVRRCAMTAADHHKFLPLALRSVGVIFIFGIYLLGLVWPSGWVWHSGRSEYLEMIIAIYASLGVFLILAARNPAQHVSLISFTIWSSIAHALVMGVQSVVDPMHIHHLYGDVLALLLVAALLGYLAPEALRFPFTRTRT